MADTIWNDLCKQPILKAPSEKYAQLVHDSTTRLHQSLEPILSALNLRAIGLTKCANFESAFHDAKVMQYLSPSSALGYIREASIYSEQGKQLEAIRVCNHGMSLVDTLDTHYDTLQRVKMDAEQRQNTRIDFISQLPLDIVTTTLIPMFMDDQPLRSMEPAPFLDVSNVWCDRIIKCFGGLSFETGDDDDAIHSQIAQFARHVKRLDVDWYSEGTWLCDLLRNNDLCSLQELYIESFSANCLPYFISSLKPISDTLTHLQIQVENGMMVPMEEVLVNCPNLVSLEIAQPCATGISSLRMASWPKITTLVIFSTAEDINNSAMITCHQIRAIGKRFPSLKKLQFRPCEDTECIRVVLEYYPWMNNLDVIEYGAGFDITFYDDGHRCNEVGITRLFVDIYHMTHAPWESVVYVLCQHRKTLEYIHFDVDTRTEPEEIYNIEYVRLKKLHLQSSGWWIPHNAPMLEELEISCFVLAAEFTVRDTTPLPPNLKKLKLDLSNSLRPIDKTPFARYLHRYAQHLCLKELAVSLNPEEHIDNMLEAILHLGQLERLSIFVSGHWDSIQMQELFEELPKGCPNLSSLMISCENAPTIYAMSALKRLEHLEEFRFHIWNMDGNDGFWHAIASFSQLKCIHVYPANTKNIHHLRHLHAQRPDLKIVANKRLAHFYSTVVI
ncbi:hypothetical protein O0I10_006271 [Lichtheimia ornata]|uniref:F-box domain-containing protein n=1 Tax=Lichtheimia ornata TaxID=688661 RepID=A0AAD7V372_9FUNG|nr:uncharacterized protein O0I10_006271 [Lichtheimia ornata]KAJ8658000.1 hypothetical protein O0I10_006271 [Lichtheimia ornata]